MKHHTISTLLHPCKFENQPVGTLVGNFHANDPDANSMLYFSLADENDTGPEQPFILDVNGSLYTGRAFDYEMDDQNFSIFCAGHGRASIIFG